MKKFWEPRSPNINGVIELWKHDGTRYVGYYLGKNFTKNTITLSQVKPASKHPLTIEVALDDCIKGRVLTWR